MTFDWDPRKNDSNRDKHGLALIDAQALWNVPAPEFDLGLVHGEYRYARLGMLFGAVHIAIFSFRGSVVRLISARRATSHEAKMYEQFRQK